MITVLFASALLVVATGFLHYEVLRGLNNRLPGLAMPDRFKLLLEQLRQQTPSAPPSDAAAETPEDGK